jgi:hypothetical protein
MKFRVFWYVAPCSHVEVDRINCSFENQHEVNCHDSRVLRVDLKSDPT